VNIKYKPYPTIVGIPKAHQFNSLENFENYYTNEFYKDLESIANHILEGTFKYNYLILCGSPGSGKTHYLTGLYKALLTKLGYLHGDGALLIPFPDLMTEMIIRFNTVAHSMRELLVEYWQAHYLFLDDVTSTERVFKNDSMEFNIFRDTLIDRWDNNKVMLFTSNFSRDELVKFVTTSYGNYVASRVVSSSKIIEFPKKDFRFAKNKDIQK
jgi:DNA replication protein DnaC